MHADTLAFTRGRIRHLIAALAITFALSATALTQTESVIYSFTGAADGASPASPLISDAAGNLYGTTFSGGSFAGKHCSYSGCGTVFELSPSAGGWTETALYAFTGGADGSEPAGGLVMDAAGNLYGTTAFGGAVTSSKCQIGGVGCGVVFELSPTSGGGWTESVLYTFQGDRDGWYSETGLTFDAAGNLYGTTILGGPYTLCNGYGCGEVFELSPNGSGGWNYNVLHKFTGLTDGGRPNAPVTLDSAGNIYGSTTIGGKTSDCPGNSGCGTDFVLTRSGTGFKFRNIHSFSGRFDGAIPYGGLTLDAAGNVYGGAFYGGDLGGVCHTLSLPGCGVVYELSPLSSGGYSEKVLYAFTGANGNAAAVSKLTFDSAGNLYGTGYETNTSCCGFVFKLSPGQNGSWTEKDLYTFQGGTDGGLPFNSGVIIDAAGNLYGAAYQSGIANGCSNFANGCGVIYKITP
jgi:hypothetical protein